MARRKSSSAAVKTPTASTRHVTGICPVCHDPGLTEESGMREHFEQHRPAGECTRDHTSLWAEKTAPRTWQLSWDLVQHYRPDVSPWVCETCGVHAPVAVAE